MDYTLAKELKEAGFPGSEEWKEKKVGEGHFQIQMPEPLMHELRPTLSELIRACGDEFQALMKEYSHAGDRYTCSSFHRHEHGTGSSPEEAVARLWLALSRRNK